MRGQRLRHLRMSHQVPGSGAGQCSTATVVSFSTRALIRGTCGSHSIRSCLGGGTLKEFDGERTTSLHIGVGTLGRQVVLQIPEVIAMEVGLVKALVLVRVDIEHRLQKAHIKSEVIAVLRRRGSLQFKLGNFNQ